MTPDAVSKARLRLQRAKQGLDLAKRACNYYTFEQGWRDLLLAGNAIHSLLEKGARESPQSRQWFGRKKRERRLDPLLAYMHQARNADEHGVHPIAVCASDEDRDFGGTLQDSFHKPDGIYGNFVCPDGSRFQTKITPPDVELVPAIDDRFGTAIAPPRQHRGAPLTGFSPIELGEAWVSYLEELIEEAAARS